MHKNPLNFHKAVVLNDLQHFMQLHDTSRDIILTYQKVYENLSGVNNLLYHNMFYSITHVTLLPLAPKISNWWVGPPAKHTTK